MCGSRSARLPNKWAISTILLRGVMAWRSVSCVGTAKAGSSSKGTGTNPWAWAISAMSGIVIADINTSLPAGKSNSASSKSHPLRTERQTNADFSLVGQARATASSHTTGSRRKSTVNTPAARSRKPTSIRFRHHMMGFRFSVFGRTGCFALGRLPLRLLLRIGSGSRCLRKNRASRYWESVFCESQNHHNETAGQMPNSTEVSPRKAAEEGRGWEDPCGCENSLA